MQSSKNGMMETELQVVTDGATLAGSRWDPAGKARALVLMHPGSGPADRDNDVYFPPIRAHLLANDFAVVSFDKRGVGESTGDWLDAPIDVQTQDLLACLTVLGDLPIVLFGHSQGGWVVLEAAAVASGAGVVGVITNSGPGVTPADQEVFAARSSMARAGWATERIESGITEFHYVLDQIRHRVPFQDAVIADDIRPHAFVPDTAELWDFAGLLIDHDPAPALSRLEVPLLAMFGAVDTSVPVAESLRSFSQHTPPALLRTAVFPDADHRLQVAGELAPGYLKTLSDFISELLI